LREYEENSSQKTFKHHRRSFAVHRIQTYLDEDTYAKLQEFSKIQGTSLSASVAKLLSIALDPEKNSIENKRQFFRLLNIMNQIFLCVYDQKKVSLNGRSAQDCLEIIKSSLDGFLFQEEKN
jgi:hypothetical protein